MRNISISLLEMTTLARGAGASILSRAALGRLDMWSRAADRTLPAEFLQGRNPDPIRRGKDWGGLVQALCSEAYT